VTVKAARLLAVAGITLLCSAHVGSPDVWYEGSAGPYHVVVYVRMPGVVPGIADINVQVAGPPPDQVTAMVNLFNANAGTPPPDIAKPSPAGAGWYHAPLWIMAPGSNSVTVAVKGSKGAGSVVVPVTAVANRRLPLERSLGGILAAAGIFLFVGLVTITGAAVRESALPPGESPSRRRIWGARGAMAGSAAFVGMALFGGKLWWDAEDQAFRDEMDRPFTTTASVIPAEPSPLLQFDITDSAWVMRGDSMWLRENHKNSWSPLVTDHGKLMHLFLAREPDMSAFAHLHPTTTDSVHWINPMPDLPAGRYRVFGDVVHESGFARTLVTTVDVPAKAGDGSRNSRAKASPVLGEDDAVYVGGTAADTVRLADGGTVVWERGTEPLTAGAPAPLRFSIRDAAGGLATLEPYLGMAAHAVVLRDDGSVFIHLHPMGTISAASQATFAIRQQGDTATGAIGRRIAADDSAMAAMSHAITGGSVSFPYAFPRPGNYRIWVQAKLAGKVETAAFEARVAGEGEKGGKGEGVKEEGEKGAG